MIVVVLDDLDSRHKVFKKKFPQCICVKTKVECTKILESKKVDILYLDHDLEYSGKGTRTYNYPNSGSAAVEWICDNKPKIKQIIIHTSNRQQAPRMHNRLIENGYKSKIHTYTKLRASGGIGRRARFKI